MNTENRSFLARTLTAALMTAAFLLLAGCSVFNGGGASPGTRALQAGIQQYNDGQADAAVGNLNAALSAKPPMSNGDQVQAHKYLAFIACSAQQLAQCHDEFRKALAIDPSFTLAPAESGQPIWDPVFRAEKAAAAKKAPPHR